VSVRNHLVCTWFVSQKRKIERYAGIQVSGINAEVMPSQWEFQVIKEKQNKRKGKTFV
jgi:glutamine synthetase